MAHLVDATIFPTLHDDTIVEWNIDGQVELGDGTEQRFAWTADLPNDIFRLLVS